MAGSGTTSSAHSYSFLDTTPLAGVTYYRLRQVNVDETAAYSPVIVVQGCNECRATSLALTVVPTPSTDYVRVAGPNGIAIPLYGTLYNLLGAAQQTLSGQAVLDLRTQPAGVYVLRLATAQGPVSLRVVKE